MLIDMVRTLTGATVDQLPDDTVAALARVLNVDLDETSLQPTLQVAVFAAETLAANATRMVGVTQVEDITVSWDKQADAWLKVAERLRARLDDLTVADDDGGPFVVEFRHHTASNEAVERGFNSF
ncbi:MAG: hypothetical protein E6Y12_10595 [Dermabacter sp.]|nr:hypothetical protein [Dermabacter sp.]